MKRREFLQRTSMATLGGLAVRGFSSPLAEAFAKSNSGDRVLVIVQLYGGNDGLNTVIPIDQYGLLSTFRQNVLIPQNQVLPLAGLTGTGFHPVMGGLRNLWDDGKLSIVQSVGYPNPNFSHFRSTDIWETGSDANTVLDSGWTARYLHHEYPNFPQGFPNTDMPDPLAIRVGGPIGPGLQFMGTSMGVAINNTQDPLDLAGNIYLDPVTADCKGDKLDFVRTVMRQADVYGDVIEAAALMGCNHASLYPTGNQPGAQLAQALRIVAQLICGGLRTKIYWVSEYGFDTHAQQVNTGDTTTGMHANLLKGVSDAIHAFQADLAQLGLEDRVMGMTFSEFGRRVMSNGSIGTDHGAAAPMFLFGSKVIPGMLGTNPQIDANTNVNTNLPMQYDFRAVYASVLRDWFCLDQADVDQLLLGSFQPLQVIDPAGCVDIGIHELNQGAGTSLLEAYPNPFVERTTLRYTSHGGRVMIQLFNERGQLIRTLMNADRPAGEHLLDADLGDLATGLYHCRLQNEGRQQMKSLLKVR